jgi:hypothetical protein
MSTILFISGAGVETSLLLLLPLIGLLHQPWMTDRDDCGVISRMFGSGIRSTRRKPVAISPYLPQIPHDLTPARTRTATVGTRPLIAWATAPPSAGVTVSVARKRRNKRDEAKVGRFLEACNFRFQWFFWAGNWQQRRIDVTATNKYNAMDDKKLECSIRTGEMEKGREIMALGMKWKGEG